MYARIKLVINNSINLGNKNSIIIKICKHDLVVVVTILGSITVYFSSIFSHCTMSVLYFSLFLMLYLSLTVSLGSYSCYN